MKYWTSSRVGAVPQPSTKPKDRSARYGGGRKKGITMEDLKKQTALRLAHEQKQHQHGLPDGGVGGKRGDTYNPRSPSTPGIASPPGVVRGIQSSNSADLSPLQQQSPPVPRVVERRGVTAAPPHHHAGAGENNHIAPAAAWGLRPAPSHQFDQGHGRPAVAEPQVPVVQMGSAMYSALDSASSSHSHQRRPRPLSSHSSSSFDSSSLPHHHNKSAKSKAAAAAASKSSKLPHGLTVSELKEMTKARLQAEAAVGDKDVVSISPAPHMFEHRDQAPPPPSSAQQQNRPPQLRPRAHSQGGRDAWSQADSHSRATEAWENCSVSTAASDYLGSEAAYGSTCGGGVGSFCAEDPSPSPAAAAHYHGGHRTATPGGGPGYNASGGGPVINFSDVPPPESVLLPGVMPASSGSYLDGPGSGIPNRRRAATLSPRQGLGFLDERHEVFHHHQEHVGGPDMPTMPSFSTPLGINHHQQHHNNHRGYPPSRNPTMGVKGLNLDPNGHHNGFVEPNRARTSSAASLPAMSGTADEFSVPPGEVQQLCQNPSFRRIPSGIGTLREDAPSPSVTGLADVFRESPSPAFPSHHRAPPGMGGGGAAANLALPSGLGSVDSFGGGSGGDPRGRAATWAGSTADSIFGPCLIVGGQHQQHSQEGLCDDLATILNLSVGGDDSVTNGGASFYPPPGL